MTARRKFRGGAFGRQFADQIVRLGVPLPSSEVERLSSASEDQVLLIVRRLLPTRNPQIADLSARRGPIALARDLAGSYRAPSTAAKAIDTAMDVDAAAWSLSMLADALSSIDVA